MKQINALDARLQASVAALHERLDALESDLEDQARTLGARLFALEARADKEDVEDDLYVEGDQLFKEDLDWPEGRTMQERINRAIRNLEGIGVSGYINDQINRMVDEEGYVYFNALNPHGLQALANALHGVVIDGERITFGEVERGVGLVDPVALGEDFYRRHVESQWTVAGYSLVDFKERGLVVLVR